jgi:antitoxin VapB
MVEFYIESLPWWNMALNIKNPEVHRLAAELARLRDVSVTQAVLDAVQHELAREKGRRNMALTDQLLAIGKRCAAHIKTPVSSGEHATLLYDDRGLPR